MSTNPLLLHSVSYAGLWGQATLGVNEFLIEAAELGFDGVMLMAKRPHASVLDYDGAKRLELRRQIESCGLRHVTLAGYCNLTADLDHGETPHLEMQTAWITELARFAAEIGAPLLRIYTGYESAAASYTAQWRLVVSVLRECARRTAPLGVTLGVQNHHDIACDYRSLHDLLTEVDQPNCRAMFDAWSPALQGADLASAAAAVAPLTVQTTVHTPAKWPGPRSAPSRTSESPATLTVVAKPSG